MKKNVNKGFKYVETYDNIVKIIKEAKLKPGDLIPSENVLQKKFNVSRGTIRQAIALLKEDGIIYNHQGKGNILIDTNHDYHGLENIKTSIFSYIDFKYSKIELNVEFQPASDKMKEYLKKTENFIVMVINAKYFVENEIVCLAMYFINYEDIKEYEINLNDNESLISFIDNYIKDKAFRSELNIKSFLSRSSVAQKMNLDVGNPLMYFSEVMVKENQEILLYRKIYFNPEYFTFRVNRFLK